jgi:acetyl esterase/lipase
VSEAPARASHVYAVRDGAALEADVIGLDAGAADVIGLDARAADVIGLGAGATQRRARRPAVVWIHGGGLIFGSRKISPRPPFVRALLAQGFVVISIDHRLAPETKLPGIVDDVRAAWRWVHESGPERFGIDTTRVAIAGASAGGYLALMGGHRLEPRPRAVASFWGFGDITGDWEALPSEHYRRSAPMVTREQALASLAAPPVPDPALGVDRSAFYLYCRQQGLWLHEVLGRDARSGGAVEFDAYAGAYCPVRHVHAAYPPTVLVHGSADTDVPHDESARLAARLAECGVPHRWISLPGIGHGFAGATPEQAEAVENEVAGFLASS